MGMATITDSQMIAGLLQFWTVLLLVQLHATTETVGRTEIIGNAVHTFIRIVICCRSFLHLRSFLRVACI